MYSYKIYYEDNSVYEGPIGNAPTIGVIFLVEQRENSRTIFQRNGYWIYTKEGIVPIDNFDGLLDYMLHKCNEVIRVFQGRGMNNESFWEYYKRVKEENP